MSIVNQSQDSLLAQIAALENEMREVTSQPTGTPGDMVHSLLRGQLRQLYTDVLLHNILYASTHDIEQRLWKVCFHKSIDEYRRWCARVKDNAEQLQGVQRAFESFLAMAYGFYYQLVVSLRNRYGVAMLGVNDYDRVGMATYTPRRNDAVEAHVRDAGRQAVHRCIVFLGDIARYRELLGSSTRKTYDTARYFYTFATRLDPLSGSPHNQLGVIATYLGDEMSALYHYARSLNCISPFHNSGDNVKALFENNRQRLGPTPSVLVPAFTNAESRSGANTGNSMGSGGKSGNNLRYSEMGDNRTDSNRLSGSKKGPNRPSVRPLSRAKQINELFARFVQLHGMREADECASQEFKVVANFVLESLRGLLKGKGLSETATLRMMIVNVTALDALNGVCDPNPNPGDLQMFSFCMKFVVRVLLVCIRSAKGLAKLLSDSTAESNRDRKRARNQRRRGGGNRDGGNRDGREDARASGKPGSNPNNTKDGTGLNSGSKVGAAAGGSGTTGTGSSASFGSLGKDVPHLKSIKVFLDWVSCNEWVQGYLYNKKTFRPGMNSPPEGAGASLGGVTSGESLSDLPWAGSENNSGTNCGMGPGSGRANAKEGGNSRDAERRNMVGGAGYGGLDPYSSETLRSEDVGRLLAVLLTVLPWSISSFEWKRVASVPTFWHQEPRRALPEDVELEGFIPTSRCLTHIDLRSKYDEKAEKRARIYYLVGLGVWLARVPPGDKFLNCTTKPSRITFSVAKVTGSCVQGRDGLPMSGGYRGVGGAGEAEDSSVLSAWLDADSNTSSGVRDMGPHQHRTREYQQHRDGEYGTEAPAMRAPPGLGNPAGNNLGMDEHAYGSVPYGLLSDYEDNDPDVLDVEGNEGEEEGEDERYEFNEYTAPDWWKELDTSGDEYDGNGPQKNTAHDVPQQGGYANVGLVGQAASNRNGDISSDVNASARGNYSNPTVDAHGHAPNQKYSQPQSYAQSNIQGGSAKAVIGSPGEASLPEALLKSSFFAKPPSTSGGMDLLNTSASIWARTSPGPQMQPPVVGVGVGGAGQSGLGGGAPVSPSLKANEEIPRAMGVNQPMAVNTAPWSSGNSRVSPHAHALTQTGPPGSMPAHQLQQPSNPYDHTQRHPHQGPMWNLGVGVGVGGDVHGPGHTRPHSTMWATSDVLPYTAKFTPQSGPAGSALLADDTEHNPKTRATSTVNSVIGDGGGSGESPTNIGSKVNNTDGGGEIMRNRSHNSKHHTTNNNADNHGDTKGNAGVSGWNSNTSESISLAHTSGQLPSSGNAGAHASETVGAVGRPSPVVGAGATAPGAGPRYGVNGSGVGVDGGVYRPSEGQMESQRAPPGLGASGPRFTQIFSNASVGESGRGGPGQAYNAGDSGSLQMPMQMSMHAHTHVQSLSSYGDDLRMNHGSLFSPAVNMNVMPHANPLAQPFTHTGGAMGAGSMALGGVQQGAYSQGHGSMGGYQPLAQHHQQQQQRYQQQAFDNGGVGTDSNFNAVPPGLNNDGGGVSVIGEGRSPVLQ
ncbi:hypothetical protein SARC_00839 [Sphaeroforma arctica JP610]|uniref:Telomerase activating protein Est1-like N-terminal domain-containing protein n=1 Tax=Sphaeroforma arctica JP610 TaxID=667725 RepID=A0A0L0GDP1_9EUKA|nr:hypothetical protein SARC_00839 [Sphaeroforma arctica JP610]KNC87029.1 hypothetical protein SARC_00839 [Sphaeroforma arctica JP610]|eukprot:XP_014160931.1 hypothetical protein SARC_00839 [Sphaeroforma arctica JP610]